MSKVLRSAIGFGIGIVLTLGACVHTRATTVGELTKLQTNSSYHPLFYVGSDERFHYFNHLNVKYWQEFRVPRDSIELPFEFPRDAEESKVMWPGTLEKAATPGS